MRRSWVCRRALADDDRIGGWGGDGLSAARRQALSGATPRLAQLHEMRLWRDGVNARWC